MWSNMQTFLEISRSEVQVGPFLICAYIVSHIILFGVLIIWTVPLHNPSFKRLSDPCGFNHWRSSLRRTTWEPLKKIMIWIQHVIFINQNISAAKMQPFKPCDGFWVDATSMPLLHMTQQPEGAWTFAYNQALGTYTLHVQVAPHEEYAQQSDALFISSPHSQSPSVQYDVQEIEGIRPPKVSLTKMKSASMATSL